MHSGESDDILNFTPSIRRLLPGSGRMRLIAVVMSLSALAFAWSRFTDLAAAQNVAQRFADLPASQNIALRFPDLSASQNVALRFLDVSAFDSEALRIRLSALQQVALGLPDLSASHSAVLHFLDNSKVDDPESRDVTTSAPSALAHLIDFQVASALPPMGHSRFCLRYPEDCKVHGIDFRRRNIAVTPRRWNELNQLNRDVNRAILAKVTPESGATEEWAISPRAGDCKNYAITKRHELLARGWPSRSLLLSEVVLPSGEHHLLLVVRLRDADLVLDNLSDDIRLAATTYEQYRWVRIQSPQNPRFWMRVQKSDPVHSAELSH
jgi:predicted transglutaminase-like cysteine proteinase